ncbi:M12 family metallo-peptidase [Nitrospira sp. M1]
MRIFGSRTLLVLCLWGLCVHPMVYAKNELSKPSREQEKFEILYHEVLPPMILESRKDDETRQESDTSRWTWSFESFGRSFILHLESNDRLIAKLATAQRQKVDDAHQLYKGKIAGIDKSWVRLTRIKDDWYGMMWDGHEVYVIDPMSVIEPALPGPSLARPSALGMYRLSDTKELESQTCGVGHGAMHANSINDYNALVQELQDRVTANAEGASLNLDMAVVADVEFSNMQRNVYGTSTNAAVIARINVVDGIFSEQVGVQINLVEIQELTNNGSLTSTDPRTLIDQFGNFTNAPSFTHPGVAHLFTGRNLNGSTIGIAYISALCHSRFGVGVNEVTGGGTARALVVAHELGHNFGAPHDAESGSACASAPNTFLMNPIINGSDQFSQCSVAEMQPEINRASCISVLNFDQSDLRVDVLGDPFESVLGNAFSVAVRIHNDGPARADAVTANVTFPAQVRVQGATSSSGSCSIAGGRQVSCGVGNIPNGGNRTMTLTVQGQAIGMFVGRVEVASNNDPHTANNVDVANIRIGAAPSPPPSAGVFMNFQPTNASTPPGYQSDTGAPYTSSRGYGWSTRVNTRERQAVSDQRLDTFIHFDQGTTATWNYDLPNGTYRVTLVSGDPSYPQGPHHITVEGQTVLNRVSTAPKEFKTITNASVRVTDGKLTVVLRRESGNKKTILNYLMIAPSGSTSPPPPNPPPPPAPPSPPPNGDVLINFQPANASTPVGYRADSGAPYAGSRGYGWSTRVNTRERRAVSDQRLDTFIHFDQGTTATWNYDLPNGTYRVTLVSGDPSYPQGPHHITVEGQTVLNRVSTAPKEFKTITNASVRVTDGKLTVVLRRESGNKKTILNYLMIAPSGSTSPPPPPPPPPAPPSPPPNGDVLINFQPANASTPVGYRADSGAPYTGSRGYGWSTRVNTRERRAVSDQRLDTFIHFDQGTTATWNYDLPNGTYHVSLASGDPSYPQGPHHITVEGQTVLNRVSTRPKEFNTITNASVRVTDGKLTVVLRRESGNKKTILNYLMISPVP